MKYLFFSAMTQVVLKELPNLGQRGDIIFLQNFVDVNWFLENNKGSSDKQLCVGVLLNLGLIF